MPVRKSRIFVGIAALAVAALGFLWWWTQTPTDVTHWRLSIPHSRFGPIEVLADLERYPLGSFRLRSSSAAVSVLKTLPGASNKPVQLNDGSWVFDIRRVGEAFEGESMASRAGDKMRISTLDDTSIVGEIESGWFKGPFSAVPVGKSEPPLRNYVGVVEGVENVMRSHLFDESLVGHPTVLAWLEGMKRVAESSRDDVDMVLAAQWAAPELLPFSHFELKRSEFDATTLARSFDEMDLPVSNVELEIHDGIAFLAIHRFMGRNTEDSIRNAIARIVESKCSGLVVDLRGNPGGAFAIVPLIEGLIAEPAFAGVFVTQAGRRAYPDGPGIEVIDALPEWHEQSLIAWWEALGKERLIKVVVRPIEHPYGGPVAVLVDGQTESAAELATQVLQSSGRVIVVGAQTPGKMLSAAHFDVGGGFVLSLPVADYLAQGHLRIEGVGITPDVVVDPSLAKDAAVAELSSAVAHGSSGTAQP